jgi:hypothetical protein
VTASTTTDPREVIARALRDGCEEGWPAGSLTGAGLDRICREDAERALAALSAAGWTLLPPGGETREQWNIRDAHGRVNPELIPCYDRRLIEGLLPDRPGGQLVYRKVRSWDDGSQWTGPWTVVTEEEPADAER